MSKNPLTVTTLLLSLCVSFTSSLWAQDTGEDSSESSGEKSDDTPQYPLAVAIDGASVYTVDLDLPGVWRSETSDSGESTELFVRGSKFLRKAMNRPRCIVMHPEGGILVGDSASRDVYFFAEKDAEPKGLTSGYIGIPMALAVSPDGKMVYIGDAEKRATFKVPIDGGECELVARVNSRGLAFDGDGKLWAVTPDSDAVVSIDVETGDVTAVVTDRPYQYANGLCWAGDHGYISDGYSKAIWKFTADGKTEKWHEGEPLVGPVGIAVTEDSVLIADPKQKQVYQFDRETKEVKTRL